jgi:hypothetical protein
LFSALQHPNFYPNWISFVISKNLFANELKFNHLKLYSGALHLCPLPQTLIYKYYGAPHLVPLPQTFIHKYYGASQLVPLIQLLICKYFDALHIHGLILSGRAA